MHTDVRLPQLAGQMTSARLSAWLKREGDHVDSGEPLVEFESDKTNVELEAPASGVLQGIRFPNGTDGVPVGSVLAVIVSGSEAAATKPERGHAVTSPSDDAAPAAPELATAVPTVRAGGPSTRVTAARDRDQEVGRATPLAVRVAHLMGVDLASIAPGPGGRIMRADVEASVGGASRRLPDAALSSRPRPSTPPAPVGPFRDVPLSAMRRTTAARLQEAKQTIPHFYLQAAIRMDAILELRSRMNAAGEEGRVSVNDLVAFALSRALVRVPGANAAWNHDSVRVFDDVDLAVAVSTDTGLIAPVLRRAHTKSLAAISRELKALASRARAGALTPDEYSGGTFTLSNLGMYAVSGIVPIVNPPQACILGVGHVESTPVVVDGAVRAGAVMTCTLAADHRAIDGATGAELLGELRRLLEDPVVLALRA